MSEIANRSLYDYNKASALFRKKNEKPRIYIFVEDGIDSIFWRSFLCPYENDFCFILNTVRNDKGEEVCGKQSIFKTIPVNTLNATQWACIDADYDDLVPGYFSFGESDFIIRTPTYSIENMKCDYSLLNEYVYKSTLASNIQTDYQKYIALFSELMIPLFALNLTSEKYFIKHPKEQHVYSIKDFTQFVNQISLEDDIKEFEKSLKEKVNAVLETERYRVFIHANKKDFDDYKYKLNEKANYAYMFMNGHAVMSFVRKVVSIPSKKLFNAKMQKLSLIDDKEQKTNAINKYKNSVRIGLKANCLDHNIDERLKTLMTDSSHFETCAYYKQLQGAIRKVIQISKEKLIKNP